MPPCSAIAKRLATDGAILSGVGAGGGAGAGALDAAWAKKLATEGAMELSEVEVGAWWTPWWTDAGC